MRNRLYRAPVLEGAGDGPDAAGAYAKAFVPNAQAGVGLIIQGSACIYDEGRTSPGMTLASSRDRVLALGPMVAAVHAEGAAIHLQIGHGGLYAMEAWHEPYASRRRGPLLAASPVPWPLRPAFAGVPVHVLTTDEVHAMARRTGDVAAWAREAGYDGVQLGSANAKLLDQFLSPFYNRRDDEFGGSAERRAHVLHVIRRAVAERAGADFPCTVKVPVEVAPPFARHVTRPEALETCRLVAEWGFDAVTPVEVSVLPDTTLSRGSAPSGLWDNAAMRARFRAAAPRRARRATLIAGAWLGGRRAPFTPCGTARCSPRSAGSSRSRCSRWAASAPPPRPGASSRAGRPTWWASAGRSTPSPTSPAACWGPATPTRRAATPTVACRPRCWG